MNHHRPYRVLGTPLALLLALSLGLALGLAGCSLTEPGEKYPPPPTSPASGHELYQLARQALLSGQPATAQAWFAQLAGSTPDPELKRQALYGQAAAALATARTPQQAAAALELWKAWQQQAPNFQENEDPRLLEPALRGLAACLPGGAPAPVSDPETRDLRQRVNRLNDENQRLKKQLSDLEALHRELLERKNRLGR